MGKVYRRQMIEGVSLPGIIRNGSYFFTELAVYEDGVVSCWHKSGLEQFQKELERGWVVPSVPKGENLNIHGLASFQVEDACWKHSRESYYQYIQEVVRQLNPEMANIYRATQQEIQKWEKYRVTWAASPTACKLQPGFGYSLTDGETVYIFFRQENSLLLTFLTAYQDKTLQVDAAGEKLFTPEEVDRMFEEGVLCTEPKEGEWVTIPGLGKVMPKDCSFVPQEEKRKEVAQLIRQAAGEEDAHDRCIAAYHQYLVEPSDWSREKLRQAYEEVPEHQRIYLGDMDTKDGDIRRILFHPKIKREV